MLRSSWKNHLRKVIYAYNCTGHNSTGYLSYYIRLGRKPLLQQTSYFRWKKTTHKEYLESWKDEMEDAFEVAITKSTGRKEKDVRRK